ncbi:hypothetical protein J6590_105497 [Homalodisca vitripennis]|nr:hypothetical protein J6590_105497 [Homalodisca vitripennis]
MRDIGTRNLLHLRKAGSGSSQKRTDHKDYCLHTKEDKTGLQLRTGATLALTWALMELFWTNEKAAMAARPRPLPPSPPPSHTPRPLLDPLRRPPANGRAASPPPYESDGGRAMADGVMADEQKFVSPAAGIRTRTPTNARLSR